ncbi:MAG: hypothetical protein EYC67_02025 [Betaproteobacteria bacterium]|nr:MAG: hypothetical protein EYC67_02025 [Betaproteobacteria bacterium]
MFTTTAQFRMPHWQCRITTGELSLPMLTPREHTHSVGMGLGCACAVAGDSDETSAPVPIDAKAASMAGQKRDFTRMAGSSVDGALVTPGVAAYSGSAILPSVLN